jgi:competence protein ComFA
MGRIRFCSPIVYGAEPPKTEPAVRVSGWNNRDGSPADRDGAAATGSAGHRPPAEKWGLSPAQAEAVERGLQFMRNRAGAAETDGGGKRRLGAFSRFRGGASADDPFDDAGQPDPPSFLIWAVTGAGKTEMIFPLIDDALARGGRALVATPRRDVVLELEPRLKRAFPERTVVALYGGSPQRWERGDITLATTHQLLRFRRHFDLTVIDELDAFPYHNNPMLQFAARRVCKSDGVYVLLSATPPPALQQAARRNRLPHAKVPVRFHRHPLPVPTRLRMKPLASDRPALPGRIIQAMASSVERGAQIFVFVPRIGDVEPVVHLLRASFGRLRIEGTSSQDPDRADKVRQFRDGTIRMLVTTTILERGVTVPKTDVFVLSADSPLFDEAALVQMAGRAGRSKDDPKGNVYFCSAEKTRAQTGAIRHIRAMNRLAKRKGFLIET